MRKLDWAVLTGAIMLIFVSAFAPGGGGVPSPFVEKSNRKVELADGEMYTLLGKVVFDNADVPYLWVDLSKHTWLANQRRIANPFYRLMGSRDQWKQYEEKSIQLICYARGGFVDGQYVIELSPVTAAGARAVVQRDR